MRDLAARSKEASRALATISESEKNDCLRAMAAALESNREILEAANVEDLKTADAMGLSAAMVDRLRLNEKRIEGMATGLREVADLPDPTTRVLDERVAPNGLRMRKVACPLGVVVIIYESRPNVTADAAGLCFKAGNATILRGGKEALHSNRAIAQLMVDAAKTALPKFPDAAIQVVPTTDRAAIPELLSHPDLVDLCMPRGGEGLIRAVADCSKVPVIKHYKGICSVYVDQDADLDMAEAIAVNSKTQRPGVCNAAETILVHRSHLGDFLPRLGKALVEAGVEIHADESAFSALNGFGDSVKPATEDDWSTEYLELIVALKVVDSLEDATRHINQYGSGHSDSIVTSSSECAERFMNDVDSAAVYWNASTRFTDGAEFGMGAEIGISTDKVGARGPMGLEELTTYKWKVYGSGQIRT